MFQRDYILRMIEHLGHVLIQLRNRILGRQGDAAAAVQELQAVAAQTGIDLTVARTVDMDTLRLLMSFAGDLDPARCWLTAELLYLEGLAARESGDASSASRDFTRALELLELLPGDWHPFEELPSPRERREELRNLLGAGG